MTFYTYLWLREDGTPYYAGKGHGKRAFRKGSPSRDRVLLQEFTSEQNALFAEKLLIALYGRKCDGGLLINITEGGEGTVGLRMSLEAKQKMRNAKLGKKLSSEQCEQRRQTSLRLTISPETRAKMIASRTGRPCSAETKEKLRQANLGKRYSDETKAKHAANMRGNKHAKRKVINV